MMIRSEWRSKPLFGAYSLETYRRRQGQKHTKSLIGHKPVDIFKRMNRNVIENTIEWGGRSVKDDFLKMLEMSIFESNKESLLELD